jgi:hypothetical protein
MSNTNTGGPAFPSSEWDAEYQRRFDTDGMTLRDYFAAKAMQGMLANPQQDYAPLTTKAQEAIVSGAYEVADAMLSARGTEKAREA